ncbi:MAG: HAD hydrolase-like protein, partial [Promethearchaeota archaeon]
HVGDRIRTDVIGANQQGWKSFLVKYDFLAHENQTKTEKSNLFHKFQQPSGTIKHLSELEFLLDEI